jgi:hypothetical protein
MKRFAFLIIFASGVAQASDWQVISSNGDKSLFMDFSSVASVGNYRKAWIMSNYSKEQPLSQFMSSRYASAKTLFYFDCSKRTITSTQDVKYSQINGGGEVVSSQTFKFAPAALSDVIPDTEGELFLQVACGSLADRERIRSANKVSADQFMKKWSDSGTN